MEANNTQQETTKFNPSPEQLVFANYYIQTYGNIKQSFTLMGTNRAIYYDKWRYQEGFDHWLQAYAKAEVLKRVGRWYLLLEKFAEKGSFQHLDRLLQIAKEFLPKAEGAPNINVFPPGQKVFIFRDIKMDEVTGEAPEVKERI